MARDQTQPGSFSRERGEPGYEVGMNLVNGVILLLIRSAIFLVSVKPQQEKSIHSTKEEDFDQDMHLLRVKFLEVSGVNDKSTTGEIDEWKERVPMGDKTLQCQFDTGTYASVINVTSAPTNSTKSPNQASKQVICVIARVG